MFAIFESLGRQYKVSVGDIIKVDLIAGGIEEAPVGSKIIFTNVLAVGDADKDLQVGKPYLDSCSVTAELIEHAKDKKVIAFKKKRRKGYRRKIGFRRAYTTLRIQEIKAA